MKFRLYGALLMIFFALGTEAVRSEVLVRISRKEYVHEVKEIAGEVWLAMDSGAFRINPVSAHSPEEVLKIPAKTIAEIRGEVWIGTAKGVFRVDSTGNAIPALKDKHLNDRLHVTALLAIGNAVWLGAEEGLFLIEDHTLSQQIIRDPVYTLAKIGETIWVGTRSNAYQATESGTLTPIFQENFKTVSGIVGTGTTIWLITNLAESHYGTCFQVNGESVEELEASDVISVAEVRGGEVWVGTIRGILQYGEGGNFVGHIGGITEPVNVITEIQGQVWVGTTKGVYRRLEDGSFEEIPENPLGNVKAIRRAGNQIWISTSTGAYRLDQNVSIVAKTPLSTFSLNVLWENDIQIESVRYDRRGSDPYGGEISGQFKAIVRFSEESLRTAVAADAYTPIGELRSLAPPGFSDVYIRVRDTFGNTATIEPPPRVLTLTNTMVPLAVALWWFLAFTFFLIAPHYSWAMNLVMKRWVRLSGSLVAIRFFLAFPRGRRYILETYVSNLTKNVTYKKYAGTQIPQGLVQALLEGRKRVLIVGGDEVLKPLLMGLVWKLAVGEVEGAQGYIPMYLQLPPFAGKEGSIARGAAEILGTTGGISDLDLGMDFLRKGGFIFLLGELAGLDDDKFLVLRRFVKVYDPNSIIIVGSVPHSNAKQLAENEEFAVIEL